MTARSAHHQDPRKCYRIILIAQRIYSKVLEERENKEANIHVQGEDHSFE